MAYRQRTGVAATTQSILTDDPDFLRLIVEWVVQAVLEAELTAHLRYEHVRQGGQIVSHGVLIVAGVRADGHREILAVAVADTESEATYHRLFGDLRARGLSGVRLVTSDSHKGLKAAIDRHFQGTIW